MYKLKSSCGFYIQTKSWTRESASDLRIQETKLNYNDYTALSKFLLKYNVVHAKMIFQVEQL